jgi:prepilin-type processing-associated H-X9-DG protein
MSYITAIGIATPENCFDQSAIANFMINAMDADHAQARKIRTIFKVSGIKQRHSVLSDYGKVESFTLFPEGKQDYFPGTEKRMTVFKEHASKLSVAAIRNMLQNIPNFNIEAVTHLIVVSCTGMYAPGLDIDIVKALNLTKSIERTCINFMGCYAAFNALKVADAFCRSDDKAKVLIVCTELCSIHFQRKATDDNILANALFADGSAALLVEGSSDQDKKLSLEKFHNDLAYNGETHMAWGIGDLGFEMKLSSYIPDLIKKEIENLVDSLLRKLNVRRNELKYFALHPGGRKIIEAIAAQLHLENRALIPSFSVLENYGNMSSASILFVLKMIFDQLTGDDDKSLILGVAFGPGLTLESMLLRAELI